MDTVAILTEDWGENFWNSLEKSEIVANFGENTIPDIGKWKSKEKSFEVASFYR